MTRIAAVLLFLLGLSVSVSAQVRVIGSYQLPLFCTSGQAPVKNTTTDQWECASLQTADAELTALASTTSAADTVPYFTGSGTATTSTFTAFGRSLVDDANAAAGLTTLGAAGLGANTFSGTLSLLNGATAQKFHAYTTYTDVSNYRRTTIDGNVSGSMPGLYAEGAGTGANPDLFVGTWTGTGVLKLMTGGTSRWTVQNAGHFIAGVDNTYDIGASGATRPRTAYIGTSVITPSVVASSNVQSAGLSITSRSTMTGPSDGIMTITNWGGTDWIRWNYGGATEAFNAISATAAVGAKAQGLIIQQADGTPAVFADLGAATNGALIYCSDCTDNSNPCTGAGTGAYAKRLNGAWVCR